jgi:hypothetical protein
MKVLTPEKLIVSLLQHRIALKVQVQCIIRSSEGQLKTFMFRFCTLPACNIRVTLSCRSWKFLWMRARELFRSVSIWWYQIMYCNAKCDQGAPLNSQHWTLGKTATDPSPKTSTNYRFRVLTAEEMRSSLFWDITQCKEVENQPMFWGNIFPPSSGRKRKHKQETSKKQAASFM